MGVDCLLVTGFHCKIRSFSIKKYYEKTSIDCVVLCFGVFDLRDSNYFCYGSLAG